MHITHILIFNFIYLISNHIIIKNYWQNFYHVKKKNNTQYLNSIKGFISKLLITSISLLMNLKWITLERRLKGYGMAQKLLVKFSQRDTIDWNFFWEQTFLICRFSHFYSHFNKFLRKFRHEVDITSLARHQDVEFIKIANSTGFSIRFLLAPTGVRVIKTNTPGRDKVFLWKKIISKISKRWKKAIFYL